MCGFKNAATPSSNASAISSVASTVPISPISINNDDFLLSNTEFVPEEYAAADDDNEVVEATELDDMYRRRRAVRRQLLND
jgi:hypothetical protein